MILISRDKKFYYIKTSKNGYKLAINPDILDLEVDFYYMDVLQSFIDEVRPISLNIVKNEVNNIDLLETIFDNYLHKGFKPFKTWFKKQSSCYTKEQITKFNSGTLF